MIAWIFPGQGAQYPGMAKDFYEAFAGVRHRFEEAEDCLGHSLKSVMFEGPADLLTETENSQVAIFLMSVAIAEQLPKEKGPALCAGLSLGEYSALAAAGALPFVEALQLVARRGALMQEACRECPGTMAAVLGLDRVAEAIAGIPDVWVANDNCPGQVVISGTREGVARASAACSGAKRVIPLEVHGAFHSGLMQQAAARFAPFVEEAPFQMPRVPVVMNVTAERAASVEEIKQNLVKQVDHTVRWRESVQGMGATQCVEIGPKRTLAGFNKKMGIPTFSIDSVESFRDFLEGTCSV